MSSSMGLLAIFIHTHAIALERSYPVVNGMTLRLGNSVQKVEVRAKSFGPGGCGVKFALSGDGGGEFIAPPLSWSSWTKIRIGYFGRSKTTLGFEAACDTGALAEVRYEIDVAGELARSWVGACDWHDPAPYTVPATFSIIPEISAYRPNW
jgi:hypothetical protein